MCAKPLQKLPILVGLSIASCTLALQGQTLVNPETAGPIAYVYVSNTPVSGNPNVIHAFAANSAGRLTPVKGSPFAENDGILSVNEDKLYGINEASPYLDSFSIARNGSLTYLTSTNYAQFNPDGCGSAVWVFPDRTGTDLYALNFDGDCANNTYQSYHVKPSGEMTYLGWANGGAGSFDGVYLPLTFLGDNRFGYQATNNGCFYFQVSGFERTDAGDLNAVDAGASMPPPPAGYSIYIPDFTAADPANHVAIAMEPADPPGCSGASLQIGSFTADSKGHLSTTNTSSEMPDIVIAQVYDMKVSPSGKLVAVSGAGGVQILHFNGANPPTAYTGLLTADTVTQMFWDNDEHLYAISPFAGTLHVYTITDATHEEAPGSPYAITQPAAIAVKIMQERRTWYPERETAVEK